MSDKKQGIMQNITQELEDIRRHFLAARHLEAYQALSDLCHNNKKCNGFSEAADYIFNLHNELEDDIIFGRLPLAEHKIQREKIKLSYRTLMRKITSHFEDKKLDTNSCELTIRSMDENYIKLKSIRKFVEDEFISYAVEKNKLSDIKNQFNDVMNCSKVIIQNCKL